MEQLLEDLKQAMREKDTLRLNVIRMVKGEIDKIRIDQKCEITDSIFLGVIEKQMKMREDSLEQFTKANREDLKEQTKKEMEILKAYLPEPLSQEAVEQIIEQAFQQVQPKSIKEMGKIMALITPQVKGRFDIKQVSNRVQEKLKSL